MKKLLTLVLIFLLATCDGVLATTSVRYNNAGARMTISRGTRAPRSAVTFGRNAGFTPAYRRAAGRRMRAIERHKAITRAIANQGCPGMYPNRYPNRYPVMYYSQSNAPIEISRFNRNYTITPVQKSYTRNGITYYN